MKTNLESLFKRNENLENDGKWFEIGNGIKFKLRRFGGSNRKLKQAVTKFYKPYVRLVEQGLLPEQKEREILSKSFAFACVVDWEGIKDENNKDIECTYENAYSLFIDLPELLETLTELARDAESFKEDLGNS